MATGQPAKYMLSAAPAMIGLLTAAWTAWLILLSTPPRIFSLRIVAITTAVHVLVPPLGCFMAAGIVHFLLPDKKDRDFRLIALGCCSITVWFAPLAFLARHASPLVPIIGLALAVGFTRLAMAHRPADSPIGGLQAPPTPAFLHVSPLVARVPIARALFPYASALCLQAGLLDGAIFRDWNEATFLLAAGVVPLVWFYPGTPETPSGGVRKWRPRWLLSLLLATIFIVSGMFRVPGASDDSAFAALMYLLTNNKARPAEQSRTQGQTPRSTSGFGGKGLSGVVLTPKMEAEAIMLAPPIRELVPNPLETMHIRSLTIPFSGSYWFFKPWNTGPPEQSFKARGTPLTVGLHSSDQYPLVMEAHQKFSSPVEMSCCSQIHVVIKDADPLPATINMEVILNDSSMLGRQAQSLGASMINPGKTKTGAGLTISDETLSFHMPEQPLIRQFDEITIRFHLSPLRSDMSPRLSIERFVLEPR